MLKFLPTYNENSWKELLRKQSSESAADEPEDKKSNTKDPLTLDYKIKIINIEKTHPTRSFEQCKCD